jgi:hypothetical protein
MKIIFYRNGKNKWYIPKAAVSVIGRAHFQGKSHDGIAQQDDG